MSQRGIIIMLQVYSQLLVLVMLDITTSISQEEPTWKPNFTSYPSVDEILAFGVNPPNPLITWSKIGVTSTFSKDILLATIRNPNKKQKRAIFIDALMHPCEYQTATIALHIMDQLVLNFSFYQDILDSVTFYILPIANRDGFEFNFKVTSQLDPPHVFQYSSIYTVETLKTRRNIEAGDCNYSTCFGVNLALNFPYKWDAVPEVVVRNFTEIGLGLDELTFNFTKPFSPHYRGPHPCSESECIAIKNFIEGHKNEIDTYISLHGFVNYWGLPFAYDKSKQPDNYAEMGRLAAAAVEAINVVTPEGTRYGQFYNLFDYNENEIFNGQEHPGNPMDWASSIGIRFTFWVSFGKENRARYEPEDISRVNQDAWTGILVVARLRDRYGREVFPSVGAILTAGVLIYHTVLLALGTLVITIDELV